MARLTATRLLWLLAILRQTLALSAHSPSRDIEAFPAYSVVLSERALLNETAHDLLADEGSEALVDEHNAPKRHLLRTPTGQAFLCTVPVVADDREDRDTHAEKDALVQASEREKGLANGLALLEPMRNGCLYLRQGWFTYSFCYGSEIRQFHEIRVAGALGPSEDPNHEAYSLGLMPEAQAVTKSPKYGSGSAATLQQERIPARLGAEDQQGLGWEEGGRYLSQTWSSGSTCDKTGLPREVEVQFHCNTQSLDRIAWIRETSICRYVMLIHTPRLCGEPIFLEGRDVDSTPAAAIECQPVVSHLPSQLSESIADAQELAEDNEQRALSDSEAPKTEFETMGSGAEEHAHEDHLQQEPDEAELVSVQDTMLTLVYDPETGEIESAVTDDGEDVFLDSALRRMLFGEDGDGQEHAGHVDDRGAEPEARISGDVDELRQLIHDSISDALRQYARGTDEPADAAQPAAHPAGGPTPPLLHQPLDAVIQTLLDSVRDSDPSAESRDGAGPESQPQTHERSAEGEPKRQPKLQPGLHRYLQQFERQRQTVQVPPRAVLGDEEHERLKRRYARRYEGAPPVEVREADGSQGDGEGRDEVQRAHDEL